MKNLLLFVLLLTNSVVFGQLIIEERTIENVLVSTSEHNKSMAWLLSEDQQNLIELTKDHEGKMTSRTFHIVHITTTEQVIDLKVALESGNTFHVIIWIELAVGEVPMVAYELADVYILHMGDISY